jgi:toxin-antitoxin system PIN domain toxin
VWIVDVNVLIDTVNQAGERHAQVRDWWEEAMNGTRKVGLPAVAVLGFLRLSTSAKAMERSLTVDQATTEVRDWLARPVVSVVHPGPQHYAILERLLRSAGTGGNLVTDAHIAALALENGATVVSSDHDFARFEGVRWQRPALAA